MKKLCYYIAVCGAVLFTVGCNDEWKDELYDRMVSLKAPANGDGVCPIYLRYKQGGIVTYKLPVIVSGSQTNDRDYDVQISVHPDTLNDFNRAQYYDRSDLYFKMLPGRNYEFPSEICHISKGSNVALYDVTFKFEDLDLVEKYVLPLAITEDPSYASNTYKGRDKALLWVLPFNDYSGTYGSTNMRIYPGASSSQTLSVSSREARVVDEKTIFFYAGITEELSRSRSSYKVKCEFISADTTEIIDERTGISTGLHRITGMMALSADNVSMDFQVLETPTYEIKEELDADKPHIIKRNYTLTMNYKYTDYSSGSVFVYTCKGTMAMQRNVNIYIPDEDQAIIW
ncbi:MAG: DUF4973 domain-containing protein [Rikenellaceae bacterium]|jgi:hypothetical protein|nr:DUF4973 domain-containing protein [Rikenellaceae bacterium]